MANSSKFKDTTVYDYCILYEVSTYTNIQLCYGYDMSYEQLNSISKTTQSPE